MGGDDGGDDDDDDDGAGGAHASQPQLKSGSVEFSHATFFAHM